MIELPPLSQWPYSGFKRIDGKAAPPYVVPPELKVRLTALAAEAQKKADVEEVVRKEEEKGIF